MPHLLASPDASVLDARPALKNYRKGRYRGDNFCLSVSAFAEVDQTLILQIYRWLEQFFVVLKQHQDNKTAAGMSVALEFLANQDTGDLLQLVHGFGKLSLSGCDSELMAKTIHDLRGGALSALIGQLQLGEFETPDELGLRRFFFLTRDHLKIMRNALLGLDDVKREADLQTKLHSVGLITEKWQDALMRNAQQSTRLEVDCDFSGNIAECCVEFGALDRVLYNLVNNACRHTASGTIKMSIHGNPAGEEHPDDLRFEVTNLVGPADREHLRTVGNLWSLFQPAVSSTGSGFGMTVALDFVSNAYGLPTREQALEGHYLGAQLTEDDHFSVWFNWPAAADV